MPTLRLDDAEATALTNLLTYTIEVAPHPLSRRVETLCAILAKLRPEPVRLHTPLPLRRRRRG